MSYWDQTGKHQQTIDELYEKLVPSEGKANTVAGELLRAACRIYYDAYNNGFINNTSGPWKHIWQTIPVSQDDAYKTFASAMRRLKKCVNTGGYTEFDSKGKIEGALEIMIDYVVEYISRNINTQEEANTADMFDLQDESHVLHWEDEE